MSIVSLESSLTSLSRAAYSVFPSMASFVSPSRQSLSIFCFQRFSTNGCGSCLLAAREATSCRTLEENEGPSLNGATAIPAAVNSFWRPPQNPAFSLACHSASTESTWEDCVAAVSDAALASFVPPRTTGVFVPPFPAETAGTIALVAATSVIFSFNPAQRPVKA